MEETRIRVQHDRRVLVLKGALLAAWAVASFGVCFFAYELQGLVGPWPFSYWWAAQGAMLFFIAIVVFYAWAANRLQPEDALPTPEGDRGA